MEARPLERCVVKDSITGVVEKRVEYGLGWREVERGEEEGLPTEWREGRRRVRGTLFGGRVDPGEDSTSQIEKEIG
jgi:hypothetical protein